MDIGNLPTKLGKEPLVDAIFEMRFQSAMSASDILPGVLFASFGSQEALTVERLAVSNLPPAVRKSDPMLRYAPLLSLNWSNFRILLSDESVAISCKLPYPKWQAFKKAIVTVVHEVAKTGIVQAIDRYSLKYVDVVPSADIAQQVKALDWHIRVGEHKLAAEIAAVRVEIPRGEFLHLVNIQSGATVTLPGARQLEGIAIDVDTVCKSDIGSIADFADQLPSRLDAIHAANKSMFFECLTQETIQMLEPTYE